MLKPAVRYPSLIGRERRIPRLSNRQRLVPVRSIRQIDLRRTSTLHSRKRILALRKKRRLIHVQRHRSEHYIRRTIQSKASPHHQPPSSMIVAHKRKALPVRRDHRLTRIFRNTTHIATQIDNSRSWALRSFSQHISRLAGERKNILL